MKWCNKFETLISWHRISYLADEAMQNLIIIKYLIYNIIIFQNVNIFTEESEH